MVYHLAGRTFSNTQLQVHLIKVMFGSSCRHFLSHSRQWNYQQGVSGRIARRFIAKGIQNHDRSFGSVSTSEVGKFSALAKSWWDPKENPLIGMNGIRMQYIQEQMRNNSVSGGGGGAIDTQVQKTSNSPCPLPVLTGLKALDVGCGGGLLSESLARLGATVTAVDPSKELVEAARRHSQLDPRTRSIDYRGGVSVEDLAVATREGGKDQYYDIICLLEVLEHVTDPDSILSSIHSLLKPDGTLFLSTLNRTAKSKLVAIWGAEYIMRFLPIGTHDWNQFRSPQEVEEILRRNGFLPVHVSGMVVKSPPLFGRWDWRLDDRDVDVNWIGTYKKELSPHSE